MVVFKIVGFLELHEPGKKKKKKKKKKEKRKKRKRKENHQKV